MNDDPEALGDRIPIAEFYRGVAIHADQPIKRIEGRVRPEIDHIFAEENVADLVSYCADASKPPEARLLAAAKLMAMHQIAVDERRTRPIIDLEYVAACVAGLDSRAWRSPIHYGSRLDGSSHDGSRCPEPREMPLRDCAIDRGDVGVA